nr:site-specific integrase [Paenibacillus phyllosphaerae]
MFLASRIGCNPGEVELTNVYRINDTFGNLIRTKPIDSKVIDVYLKGLLPCNYNKLLLAKTTLNTFFNWCASKYDFPNPVTECSFDINAYKPFKRPARILTRHEVLRFFHCLVQKSKHLERDLSLFCLLTSTGCRINEILALRVSHFNFETETIKLHQTKSKKTQIVTLRKGMGKAIELYCQYSSLSPQDFLFVIEGKPMDYDRVVRLFKKYLRLAKIPEVNIHSTRHSFATHLFENGADITVIQQLLRHSDFQITMEYVHNNAIRNQGIKNKQNEEIYKMLN